MLPNPGSYFFNLQALPIFLVSTLIFLTGLFVLLQNRTHKTNIVFFLFCLSLNFWLYGNALMYCAREPEVALAIYRQFSFLGVSHISPLVFTFSVLWLNLYEKQKKFVWASFLIAPIFYLIGLLTPYGIPSIQKYYWGFYPRYGVPSKIFLFFFFAYFLAAFYNFFSQVSRQREEIKKKQIRLITIAFLISITGSFDYLPKIISIPLYPFGYLSVLAWTLIVAYLIVRYRILDIQTAIHKTIMWFSTLVIAISPFAILVYVLREHLRRLDSLQLSFVVLGIMIAFYFYFQAIHPKLNHLFRRRRANLEHELNLFSQELVHLKNLRDLIQRLVRMLRKTVYVKEVSIYLREEETNQLAPSIMKGLRGLKPVSMSHPLLAWIEQNDRIVIEELAHSDPELSGIKNEIEEYFTEVSAKILVPFVLNKKLIGVVHLGKKEILRRYSPEEIQFLSQLKFPVTIALSNSLYLIAMQENLQRWNEELEKKVNERTKQLQSTQAQLFQAEKLATIGTLAGGIAHEINNPLTAVLTNAQILKMDARGDDLESISLIEEGAKRCQVIIQKLLKYARKGTVESPHQEVDLHQVIQSTHALLAYQFKQDNVDVVLKLNPVPRIQGVANELEQVFTNLLINARDAIRKVRSSGTIEIETAHNGSSIQVRVSDNGAGISQENLGKVFDPFFTTKEVGSGTGLGLAVSYGILDKHHCKVNITSKENIGTTFMLNFPVAA